MFLVYDEAAKSIIKPSRAEPSRAEPSRARAEPSLGYCLSPSRPLSPLPSAPPRAQSDPLPTDSPGAAPSSRGGEPASVDCHRGPRRFLSACIRRAADALQLGHAAIRDAALTGAQPSGRSGRPSREASAARPSRGGDRRALGVGILAAAVLLTGLLGSAGAYAQTTNADGSLTLWEAEMTAASFTLNAQSCVGYRKSTGDGSLSPRTFTYEDKSWTVDDVCQISSGGNFILIFTSGSSSVDDLVDSNLNFHFGTTIFSSLTDADHSAGLTFFIPGSGLTPTAGTTYTLKFTRDQAPSAPRNLRARGVSPTQIALSWDVPEKTGGPGTNTNITGYKIEASNNGVSGWTELVASQEARTYTHMGLTASTTYHYRVSAINAAGTGSVSGVALANTAAPAPSSFMARENADGSLLLWEAEMTAASFTLNAQSCVGYRKSTGDGSLSPRTFTYEDKSWTVDDVCQISSGGNFILIFTSGSSSVDDLVDSNLNFHFGTTIFSSLTDADHSAGLTFFITGSGLTPTAGTTYTLKFTTDQAPSAPRNLRAKAVSATEIDLSWHVPEKTGGTAVTGYKIEVSNTGTSGWTELVASQTSGTYSHTVTSGVTRYYRVSAINAAGTSVASNVASATAEDTAPGVTNVNFSNGGTADDVVVLVYDETFNAAFKPDKSAFTVKIEGTVRALDRVVVFVHTVQLWLVSPFKPGETGTVSYTKPTGSGAMPLQDVAGNKAASFTNVPGVNLLPPIPPDAPTNLHAKGVSTTQIDLSWSAPEYTGGADIMGYTIEVSTDRGITWTEVVASQTATTYSHTVASGVTRYYRVSAFNAAGNGVWSRTASAGAMDSAPGVVSAEIGNPDDTVVTLFFDEAPDSNSTPAASAFTVKVGGKARTPRTATILTGPDRVRLVLAAADAVKPGERVTVSYTKPSTNRLKDAEGEETVSFTDFRVANELPTDFPELLVHDEEVHESGDGTDATMTFTVSVDKEPDFPVGVHYETEDVTATGGDPTDKGSLKRSKRSKDPEDIECDDFRSLPDYISTEGRLTFGPGETSHEVVVTVCDDTVVDSGETFRLVLRSTQLHEPISALGEIGPNGKGYGDEITASETGTILNEETTTEVSIVADAAYAEEGTEAAFTLRRAGDAAEALTVPVSVVEDGAVLGTPVPESVTFAAGSRQAALGVATEDDGANEADSTVTATVESGFAWQVAEDAASAALTVLDNDAAPVTSTSTADVTVWSADMTVVEYGPRAIGAGSADLFSNQTGDAGLRAKWLWYDPAARKLKLGFDDGLDDTQALTLHVGDVSLGFPDNTGGNSSFTLEDVDIAWSDGETVAARVSKPSTEVVSTDATLASLAVEGATLSPAFDAGGLVYRAAVDAGVETVTVAASTADGGASVAYGPAADGDTELADHQVAAAEGETLVAVTVTAADGKTVRSYRVVVVRAPANKAPAGLPAISGTAEVGEVLTASVDAIADADGLVSAAYAWQWLAVDGATETEIEGATGKSWTLTAAEAGSPIRVRVTYTDDKGTEETLVSAATVAVVDRRPVAATLSVGAGAAEAGRFRLLIAFADAVTGLAVSDVTAARVGGDAAAVSDLTEAETGREWTAWVAAADAGRYTVRLAAGAAHSGERQSLAAVLAVDVDSDGNAAAAAGPVVTSVALGMAPDGTWTDGDEVRMSLTFSEPVTVATDGGTPSVGIGLDGSTRQAVYASGTGTASLAFSYTVTAEDGTVSAVSVTADSLALNGGTIRDAGGRDADLAHPGVGEAATDETQTESVVALTGLTLVDTGTGTETALADGDALVLADPANGSYGLLASVSADAGVGSVVLALTGAKTVTVTDDASPYSLYGDEDGTVTGAGLPAGSYTLSATAYAQAGGTGEALGTLAVSFTVAAGEAVDPDALTASFEGVPEVHDGSSPFTFRVRFNLEPRVSYKVLRDESFAVTGGEVDKARRVDGRNELREIHIEPEGWEDVAVMLVGGRACGTEGAICTADSKVLANTEVAVVQGPLALGVADARIVEAANAVLGFEVTLNRAASGPVTVDYATADGTATAGADYTATSGTLTFAPGETAKTVNVPVLDDAHDDTGETLMLVLSNASGARIRDGEATGTIENSDPIPKAWLARFGRTVADHVVDAIGTRLTGPAQGGSQVTLGGQVIPLDGSAGGVAPGADRAGGDEEAVARDALAAFADRWTREGASATERSLTGRELLLGSSFVLNLSGDGEDGAGAGGPRWTAWGRASSSRFDGEADGLALDGDVTTFTLGADAARSRWLAGVAVSLSEGEGGFRDHGDSNHPDRGSGALESSLTSVHPYARVQVSERLSLWGLLGYGTGELDVEVDGVGRWSTDTTQEMAAAGVRGVLVKAPETGGFELGVRGDAVVQRMRSEAARGSDGGTLGAADARTSRLRLALEGSRAVALEGGGRFVPRLEVGLRQDGGDAETGTGIEVGGGLAWTDPARGLTVEAKARTLVAHEDAHYREWGASGSVRIDPGASGRGLSLTLAPAWGAAEGGAERLWGLGDARGLAPDAEAPAGSRLEAELGYGFAVIGGRGVATPYAGLSRSETGETLRLGQRLRTGASQWKVESAFGEAERSARVGYGYRLGPSLELSVEATRREAAADDAPEHGVMLRLGARW